MHDFRSNLPMFYTGAYTEKNLYANKLAMLGERLRVKVGRLIKMDGLK